MMRHMNDKELEYAILTAIKMKCNLYNLRAANISNEHIIRMLHQLISYGIIKRTEHGPIITNESYWFRLGNQLGRRGLYKYVLPEYFYKREKMNLEEIYIPLHIHKE